MNIEKEREALVAEIELFIAEAMKAYVVERWADSYQNTEPFSYTIDDKNEVWWMKTQAHQLWQFWKAAKTHEAQKLEGCVVVPEPEYNEMAQFKDLYKRAIVNAKKRKDQLNWAHVAGLGVGPTKAIELLNAFGIDHSATNMHSVVEAARGGK
ncbi:hypothetical protein F966_03638 [Acinetobacter higginsii]|uniref:Uncharacterized protein n=1 Tax=Acinetobacter higginsii TaxID=70347 RepID=N8W717_9GAMM|nr:hypothetical protein [Acinetobacter higginsii]ENV07781.1 hypothetical protein F966_03638 [Acinetobacter higginsii]